MLTALGFLMVFTFMYLIMAKKMTGFAALILIPILFALLGGFAPTVGKMMFDGIKVITPTAVMMMFAVMFFGIMVDVGLFDGLIVYILKKVKGDPLRVVVGSSLLAIVASLEGEGAVVFMITCTAMLPLYKRLGINPVILAVICAMVTAVKNMFPWAAPTARVLAALKLDAADIFNPLVPVIVAGFCYIALMGYVMGKKERARLGVTEIEDSVVQEIANEVISKNPEHKRPHLFWVNLVVTLTLMGLLLVEKKIGVSIPVIFLVGCGVALVINFPNTKTQQARMAAHAKEALQVTAVVFAAGIFMGILNGTKMTDAMAQYLLSIIPSSLGSHMAMITAVLSAPLSFLLSNDAFYFGVLPVLNTMSATYGFAAAEIGRASLLGTPVHMLSPLVAALWLLVGMCDITFGDLQKGGWGWALGLTILNITVGLVFGAITL